MGPGSWQEDWVGRVLGGEGRGSVDTSLWSQTQPRPVLVPVSPAKDERSVQDCRVSGISA